MTCLKYFAIFAAFLLAELTASGQPLYTGAYGNLPHCQACHDEEFSHWNTTSHAAAYDNHPELQWDESCLPCHTTGWDLALANGGFDDFFYAGDTLGMMDLRNVQCEVCHGPTDEFPHPLTTAVDYSAELCGDCHNQDGSQFYSEWSLSLHGQTASVSTQQPECARCHEAGSAAMFLSTGQASGILPEDPAWQVSCAACHATHDSTSFAYQLRQEPAERLCRSCHSMESAGVGEVPHSPQAEMLEGLGGGAFEWPGYNYINGCHEMYLPEPCVMCHQWPSAYGNPDTVSTGHSLQPDILFCASPGCHAGQVPPDSSYNFFGIQTTIDSLLTVLGTMLTQADTTSIEYAQAKFDYDFVVQDGSRGVHNFLYTEGLLISSIEGIEPVLGIETQDGQSPKPTSFALEGAFPNPFNARTTIIFSLPASETVNLSVYDLNGRRVLTAFDGTLPAGSNRINIDAGGLVSGIYIYRISAGDNVVSGKLVLMK